MPLPGRGLETVTLLKAGTEAIVHKLPAGDWQLEMKRGSILANTGKNADKPAGRFSVKTRAAVMGVRGTTFFVRDDQASPLFFCPCEGKIEVTSTASKKSQWVASKHHESRAYVDPTTGNLTPTTDAEGHSDEEITDLKSQFQVQ